MTTVPLGESVTFTCALSNIEYGSKQFYWFKQNAGETLTLIVTLLGSTTPEFAPEFSDSRLEVKSDNNLSNLTIRRTIPEDEGMYHCSITERFSNPEWSGTYLLLKGKRDLLFIKIFTCFRSDLKLQNSFKYPNPDLNIDKMV